MTDEDRTEFLAERKTGVGGSDCASLFSLGYGCRRRLWYDKSGVKPDYPREENDLMELGNVLEPFFRKKYCKETGREVLPPKTKFGTYRHPDHPEIMVHVDGVFVDKDKRGILEIKSVGRATWWDIKREGLPEDYIFQVQHGLTATFGEHGAYAIGSRDSGQLLHWDVARDNALCDLIEAEAISFWASVCNWEQIPSKLENADDSRCASCQWRLTCRGSEYVGAESAAPGAIETDDSLRPIRDELLQRKALLEQAEDLVKGSEAELKALLGERQEVLVAGRPIYWRPQTKTTWDGKGLSVQYSDVRAFLRGLAARPNEPDKAMIEGVLSEKPEADSYKKESKPFKVLRVYP